MKLYQWMISALLMFITVHSGFAARPLWSIQALDPSSRAIASNETVTIRYQVSNQSSRPHTFMLQPIPGVTGTFSGNGCPRVSGKNSAGNSSCLLTLTIVGAQMTGDIKGGPFICEASSNSQQCYRPAAASILNLTRKSAPAVGTMAFYHGGSIIANLRLKPFESNSIELKNVGQGPITNLSYTIPAIISSYLTNNCTDSLAAGAACTIDYTVPVLDTILNGTLQATGDNATQATENLTVRIGPSGGLKCWGSNNYGELGATNNIGTNTANPVPVDVQTLGSGSEVISVSRSNYFGCAALDTGAVKCWGRNYFGELGSTTNSGTSNTNSVPLDVQTLGAGSGVVKVTAGGSFVCALLETGAVKCWGNNGYGQLGSTTNVGTGTPNNVPLDVQTLGNGSGVVSIVAGTSHVCALLNTGAVKCWGSNVYGQLGSTTNSGTGNPNSVPLDVQTLGAGSGVVSIAAGGDHTCAVLDTGAVKCWGRNRYGQLGSTSNSGNNNPNNNPLNVQTLGAGSGVVKLAAGVTHSCALLNTGLVKCWGYNYYGQLGSSTNKTTNNPNNNPRNVLTLGAGSGVVMITAGDSHACALLNTGAAKCWGYNYNGQLGVNTNAGSSVGLETPVNVQTLGSGVQTLFYGSSGNGSCAII